MENVPEVVKLEAGVEQYSKWAEWDRLEKHLLGKARRTWSFSSCAGGEEEDWVSSSTVFVAWVGVSMPKRRMNLKNRSSYVCWWVQAEPPGVGDASESVLDVTGYVNFEVQGGNQGILLWKISWPWKPRTFLWKAERWKSNLSHAALSNVWHFANVCAYSIFSSRLPGSFGLWHAVSSDSARIYGKEDFLLKYCVCQGCLHWQEQKPNLNCSKPGKSTLARKEPCDEWVMSTMDAEAQVECIFAHSALKPKLFLQSLSEASNDTYWT